MAGKALKGKSASGKKSKKAPAKKRGVAAKAGSKVRSAAATVKRAVKRVATKVTASLKKKLTPKAAKAAPKAAAKPARIVRRETDIPLDRIAKTYTPQQTSIKAGFRSTGADHQSDQEFARGVADDERFNSEDVYTNKTGDPRIGTHGRAYEPGEKKNKAS